MLFFYYLRYRLYHVYWFGSAPSYSVRNSRFMAVGVQKGGFSVVNLPNRVKELKKRDIVFGPGGAILMNRPLCAFGRVRCR